MSAYEIRKAAYVKRAETALERWLQAASGRATRLGEAMSYALLNGGKRIRPLLFYMTSQAHGQMKGSCALSSEAEDQFASALEMVHSYSLVHDDLPCMDNDILRRGKPCTHVAYGEAIALLAGDALLNRAFELLFLVAVHASEPVRQAAANMAGFFGQQGMIGGQAIDLCQVNREADLETLTEMDLKKTSALIQAAVLGAAQAHSASPDLLAALEKYSLHLGLAFQIQDDCLDAVSDSLTLGKSSGKDERDQKATYVTLLGLKEAQKLAARETELALAGLDAAEGLGLPAADLRRLALELLSRKH